MDTLKLINIADGIALTSFSTAPAVKLKFHQDIEGARYYRLKCEASSTYSPGFPTTYLYLGAVKTVPNYNYNATFTVQSVKDSSLSDTSFEALFTLFPDNAELRVGVKLQSSANTDFSGTVQESTESYLLSITLTGDDFGPAWTCPTWVDQKYSTIAGVAALTGSDQKGLQGVSGIRFSLPVATARYGTALESYSIAVSGGYPHTLTPQHVSQVGTDLLSLTTYYKLVGDVTVIFTVTDSRGMSTVFTRTLTIVPYKQLYLTVNNTHRQGGTGSTVILDFAGRWQGEPLEDTDLTCTGIVAKEEGSSATFASLTPSLTISGNSFSYQATWSGVTFDPAKAYTVTATFKDTVKTVVLTFPIPVGTPVLSIRNAKVGVNNPSPFYALDVGGVIAQNGYPVMGYRGIIGDSLSADLNDCVETGLYVYKGGSADAYHFPNALDETAHILLKVYAAEGCRVQTLFDVSTGYEYSRAYDGSWTSWR